MEPCMPLPGTSGDYHQKQPSNFSAIFVKNEFGPSAMPS